MAQGKDSHKLIHLESILFDVFKDLKEYLNDLILVGGWLPYVYIKHLWKDVRVQPVTTADIDFGLKKSRLHKHSKTIFQTLSDLAYSEHHIKLGKLYPVVMYKEKKIPIDFICSHDLPDSVIERVVGRQINVSRVDGFDFLVRHIMAIRLELSSKKQSHAYVVNCPKPSAFIYHKAMTFDARETDQKRAKDLHFIYFILRYDPDIDAIFREIAEYLKEDYKEGLAERFDKYFGMISSDGCIMVEKENGPDIYINDLRKDIFNRFAELRKLFKQRGTA